MPAPAVKFGEFELDSAAFELRRMGRPIRLERLPLELLLLLVSRKGELVSRAEIIDKLWGSDVYIGTNTAINVAIRKVRQALRDDPDHPRFLLTVPSKGYRFVGTLEEEMASYAAVEPVEIRPLTPLETPPGLHRAGGRAAAKKSFLLLDDLGSSSRPGADRCDSPSTLLTATGRRTRAEDHAGCLAVREPQRESEPGIHCRRHDRGDDHATRQLGTEADGSDRANDVDALQRNIQRRGTDRPRVGSQVPVGR